MFPETYKIQQGDILFYKAHSIADGIVKLWTGSEYTHCAVALDNTTCISATAKGVARMPIGDASDVWSYAAHAIEGTNEHIHRGILWLACQIGNRYSWLDIVSQVVSRVVRGLYLYAHKKFDCSELVVRFLVETGDFNLDGLEDYPNEVTPGGLHSGLFRLPVYRDIR